MSFMFMREIGSAFRIVFSNFRYILLAFLIASAMFAFSVWFPNIRLIKSIFFETDIAFLSKLMLLINLFGSIKSNFSLFSATYTILIAVLFGINLSLLVYFWKQFKLDKKMAAVSIGGVGNGVLGVSCAACGSFLLNSVLSAGAAAGATALLPLRGGEFALLSIALLLFSIIYIARKVAKNKICALN